MCVTVYGWSPGWALKMELDWPCLLAKAPVSPYLSIQSTQSPAWLRDQYARGRSGGCDAACVGAGKALPQSLVPGWSRCWAHTGLGCP